jgi:inosine/xanthosine triphosphate pyrophosphatase family protein
VVAATGHAAIVDDTGLEVDALGGAPGVSTARYAAEDASYDDIVDKMLRELEGEDVRTLAEIPARERNEISHRAKALYALAQTLDR